MDVTFIDSWLWLIFIAFGLVLVLMELLLGIETGLDMVFIGSAFILGGLITIALGSWVWTAITSGIICVIYVFVGRRYIHQRVAVKTEKTNIDTIIGKRGFVTQDISQKKYGVVKVGMEEWRAKADEDIKKGEEITVTEISGVTLNVKRVEGGNT
ncbi:MAG TPA: NfeD family protein [Dehalococcoidia bacterium]|nr:NfeD family protein [Dehalococcoidia bacterium]